MNQDTVFIECSHLLHGFKSLLSKALIQHQWPLSPTHFKVMSFIEKMQPCTSLAVTEKLKRDKAQVARLLKDLITQAYIQKSPNLDDKRSQLLHLTEKGKNQFKIITLEKEKMLQSIFGEMPAAEQLELLRLMKQLNSNIDRFNGNLHNTEPKRSKC